AITTECDRADPPGRNRKRDLAADDLPRRSRLDQSPLEPVELLTPQHRLIGPVGHVVTAAIGAGIEQEQIHSSPPVEGSINLPRPEALAVDRRIPEERLARSFHQRLVPVPKNVSPTCMGPCGAGVVERLVVV